MIASSGECGEIEFEDDRNDEVHAEIEETVMDDGNQTVDDKPDDTITPNNFCIDYSKRGTAKCKACKKTIPKSELRIGMYANFRDRTIINCFHVSCVFAKMRRARTEANVIKTSSEIDGFENMSASEKDLIKKQIQELEEYKAAHPTKHYVRKPTSSQIPMTVRRKKLKMMKSPSMKVMFTNADQFTHSKKDELQQRILTEKPLVIAVSEVKAKHGKDRSEEDYGIDGYTTNHTNLLSDKGRGLSSTHINHWTSPPYKLR